MPALIEAYENGMIVGLRPDGRALGVFDELVTDDEDMSSEDKIALADLMIERWEAYKAKATEGSE